MTLTISPGQIEDAPATARLLADTMAGFGVAVLGVGDEEMELKALQRWFGEKDNRFSHQFSHIARLDGEIAGLVLTFSGEEVSRLSKGCARSILSIYGFVRLIKLIWRGMVLGHTKEAEKNEYLIAHVAVFKQFRRKGIARALLDKAVHSAMEASFSRVVLEVEIGNTAALLLYESYGFRKQLTTEFGRHARVLKCPGYHKMVMDL